MGESDLGSVITFNPQVARPTTTLVELLFQWSSADFHHWPVTDDELRLLGIVSEQDLARAVFQIASTREDGSPLTAEQLQSCSVQQIMSTEMVTISRWDSQINGLYRLLKHRIHSLPVLDDDRLVGVVTSTDYLREFSYGELPVSRIPVSDVVEEEIDSIDCDMSLEDAMSAMESNGREHIGIVNGALPLGVLTRRDIRLAECRVRCRQFLSSEFYLPGPTTLRELAAESPTVPPGARISHAAALMVEKHRQAIAVVTQAGRMVGVISEAAVLSAMAGKQVRAALAKA